MLISIDKTESLRQIEFHHSYHKGASMNSFLHLCMNTALRDRKAYMENWLKNKIAVQTQDLTLEAPRNHRN